MVDFDFHVLLPVALAEFVGAAAKLETGTPVGRGIIVVEAEIAFARNGHAKGSVGEDFNLDKLPGGAADVFFPDLPDDFSDLVQTEFPGCYHDIRKTGVEFHGLDVADIALGGNMDFQTDFPGIGYDSPVGGDDGVDAAFLCRLQHLAVFLFLLVVNDRVEGEIGSNPVFPANPANIGQVFHLEVQGCPGPHIEFPDPEIDGVRTGFDGRMEGGVGTYRRHDFNGVFLLYFHS